MRLNTVRLVNFRQHADSTITFHDGLTGIIGPNGAGKTTILEGIAWALYGQPAARGTRDTLRFNRAPARSAVRVELDFELAGHRYRIDRGITSAELYLDGAELPIANTISGVTDLVQRRLGMTRAEFFNTYFTGQKELNVMAAMKPVERAQFLSRVLGYEKLRIAQGLVRDRRREIMAEMTGLRSGMRDPEAVLRAVSDAEGRLRDVRVRAEAAERRRNDMATALAALAPRWERAQSEREHLHEALAELRVAESEEAGLTRESERIERELREVEAARAELEQLADLLVPLPTLANEFQQMEVLAREEGKRATLLESVRALDEEIAQLGDRLQKIEQALAMEEEVTEALERVRNELEVVEGTLEAKRTEWVRDRQEAETKRQALRSQYMELKEQRETLVALGEEGACPTCARPLGASFRTVLEELDGQIETVLVDGNYYKSRLEQLEEMPEDIAVLDENRRALVQETSVLERRLARVQLAVQERTQVTRDVSAKEHRLAAVRHELEQIPAGYDAARHAALEREIERLTPLDARAARLGALMDREPQVRREQAKVATSRTAVAARLATLRERQAAAEFSEVEYGALRLSHERAAAETHGSELAAVAAEAEVASARALVASAAAERVALERTEERLRALNSDKRLHDELDRAYSDLRTDLNFQLRPELSELASAFLTELTDARYSEIELDDQYNVLVLEEGVPKPVISGGEEDLANLVLRLAISQMIAERAGQGFSLLVLDEVFGSLDEGRRATVVELLRHLHDRFEQVVLITHVESVREGLDHVISVRYDEETGMASVEQEEPTDAVVVSADAGHQLAGAGD